MALLNTGKPFLHVDSHLKTYKLNVTFMAQIHLYNTVLKILQAILLKAFQVYDYMIGLCQGKDS